jgi:hypothetical protein
MTMNILSKLLVASTLALSFAAPALATEAPESQTLLERNVYLLQNGKMTRATVNDTTHAMIMREFKPLKAGTMVYVSGGKFYIGEDRKMTSGKMLHHEVFGREIGAAGG